MNLSIAVVEQTTDPLQMGRCRVRIFEEHNQSLSQVPVESLPWSMVMNGIRLKVGEWVVCMGINQSDVVVLGTIPSVKNINFVKGEGFFDPDSAYPKNVETDYEDHGKGEFQLTESFISKKATRHVGVPTAKFHGDPTDSQSTWNFPDPADSNQPAYPDNSVQVSESGHVFEIDDTVGSERISQFHRSGTYEEYHSNGDCVKQVVGKNYRVVMDDENVFIQGDCNVTVEGDAKILVKGDCRTEIEGDHLIDVKNDMKVKVGGDYTTWVVGNKNETVQGNVTEANANLTTTTDGKIDLNAGTEVDIDAGTINLN